MIKQTLHFSNPAYLSMKDKQLVIDLEADKHLKDKTDPIVRPIEDIGVMILDHRQITITQALMSELLFHNVALITCDETHHPVGLMLNLDGNTLQAQRFRHQVDASVPLKKQLWQQTITHKIANQAGVLHFYKFEHKGLLKYASEVKSGDIENHEAKAAAYYWKKLFAELEGFTRERYGPPPNVWLNYGYAILRAVVARSLIGSGLLPTLGIYHRNQYNSYCLADDIMEPYRPYVDKVVKDMVQRYGASNELPGYIKQELLKIPAMDVLIDGKSSPLIVAVTRTTASLARCFEGSSRKILYPVMRENV